MSPINLIDLREQLQVTGDKIAKSVKETNSAFSLKVKNPKLVCKCPDLEGLPDDLTVFACSPREEGEPVWYTIGIYEQDDRPVIVGADLEIVEGFKIINHYLSFSGYATIEHIETAKQLLIAIGYNDDFKTEFFATNKDPELVDGEPDPDILSPVPRPEIPLRSKQLPIDAPLQIVEVVGTSKKYSTPLVNVSTRNGLIKNVLCNARLQRIAEKFLAGDHDGRFVIKQKLEPKSKDGSWKILIFDPNEPNFSDLKI